jgi:hypothetical protein
VRYPPRYLSDLKTFDESHEFLTVYAMMIITWEDPRWVNASLRKAPSPEIWDLGGGFFSWKNGGLYTP